MEASVIRPLPVPALARGEEKMKAELDALKARGATIEEKYDMLWRNQVLPPARPRHRTPTAAHPRTNIRRVRIRQSFTHTKSPPPLRTALAGRRGHSMGSATTD